MSWSDLGNVSRRVNMTLLIDGYNLIHAANILGRGVGPGGLERARQALLEFLCASLEPQERQTTIVVFDAEHAPPGLPRTFVYQGISVRFSADYGDADELIEELIKRDSAPRALTVVSSDHRLHRAARRRRAKAIDSDIWYDDLVHRRRARREENRSADEVSPSHGPLVRPDEVERWTRDLEQEGIDRIFPPGYGEDLADDEH
jgi:predicted RNA-binding protein with PIN domain